MKRTPAHKEQRVLELLRLGFSTREVAEDTGVSKPTIQRISYSNGFVNQTKCPPANEGDPGANRCDNCLCWFEGNRETSRRRPRTKHTFCSFACYGDFKRRQKDKDRCKRCNKQRGKVWGRTFSRGMCGWCYGLFHQYAGDESLMQAHELRNTLRKEVQNADQQHA